MRDRTTADDTRIVKIILGEVDDDNDLTEEFIALIKRVRSRERERCARLLYEFPTMTPPELAVLIRSEHIK
jgi:hypothetical protein